MQPRDEAGGPRVVIAGGTGFLGRALGRELTADGYSVTVLTRDPARKTGDEIDGIRRVAWNPREIGAWTVELSEARAVVNLAGDPIDGLWTAAKRMRLRESRLLATAALVAACRHAHAPPALFLQGSAVGYYGDAQGQPQDETARCGDGFLSRLTADWEAASAPVEALGTRRAILRTGIVLGRGGGILARLLPIFRLGLGGTPGSGDQFMPWIHLADWTGAVCHLLAREDLRGPFNLAAPDPVQARCFTADLARALGRPAFFRAPAFALRMLLRDQADELLIADRRAVPRRLMDAGYAFRFPDLTPALEDLLASRTGRRERA